MNRKDYQRLELLKDTLNQFPNVTAGTPAINEDYDLDLPYSASTEYGLITGRVEGKSLSCTKYGGHDSEYWITGATTNVKGLWRYNYTGESETHTDQTTIALDKTPRPAYWEKKPTYFINFTDINGNTEDAKWAKLMNGNHMFAIMFCDGFLIFTPRALRESELGRAWFYCKHTNELGNRTYSWEEKVVIDLSKGKFVARNIPKELFAS